MGVDRSIDITADQRKTILSLLERYLPNTQAWAYGSRVCWSSRPASDLDMVVFATPEQDRQVANLREAFEESNLPFRVDLFVWDEVPVEFQNQMIVEHVTLANQEPRHFASRWPRTTLGELIDIRHGFAFEGKFIHDEPHNDILLTPGNFSIGGGFKGEKLKYYTGFVPREFILNGGDVIVSMTDLSKQSDTLGYPAVVPARHDERRYLHNQRLGKVLLKSPSEVDIRYIYYVMCSSEYRNEVLASATGTTVKHTSPDRIKRHSLRLPPLSEQRVIAHILGTLDDKIVLNRRMNETLEAMARALFKSWFVDYDPVRAKIQGSDIGLPKHIADLFPDRLVDPEVGEMPEGWQFGTLYDVAFLNPESWSAKHSPENVVYVDLANTKWGYIESVQNFPWDEAPSRARRVLRKGDTVIATVRPGNGSFALIGEDGLTGSTDFAVLRPREATDRGLVWCAATSSGNIDRLAHLADGGANPAVRPDEIGSTPLPLANPDIRLAFSRLANPLLDKSNGNKRASRELANLRDRLLPRLISGEIHLHDAERVAEAVS